jgi:molecular chaperone GrpE
MIGKMKNNNDEQINNEIKTQGNDRKSQFNAGEVKEPETEGQDQLLDQKEGEEGRKREKRKEDDRHKHRSKAAKSESEIESPDQVLEDNEELGKARQEIEDLKDILQRRQADFENYKKRLAKDREEQKKLAIRDLALDIININDDVLRAVEAASDIPKGESLEHAHQAFADGVKMISKQIEDVLRKYRIVEIDALNKEFNPNFNEAVEIDMSEHVKRDTVTKIYQKGFMLDDLIIRSARVKVTKPMAKAEVSDRGEGMEESLNGDNREREATNEKVGYD